MIEKIITYSVKNKLMVAAAMVALIIWGTYSLGQLSIDAVPDITNNQVQILTTTRNLSTLDVEQFISYPIEMEMANLPGVEEIRSTNKFGLSVVTIVFKDDMGTFLPRQLIAEKIKAAKEKIPAGFGSPEMGPISTGLGEIYQYIVDVKPEFQDRYTDMDLRTIQDWIIKRQLSGIDGVVEINTWGGHLKQYEIAIDPFRLKSIGVTIDEVITALEMNNGITGAGYVEKNNKTYFIRAEGLLHNLEDIRKVVIKNNGGSPILVDNIAEVKYGHAPRFGAITGNGEGEKVLGQVMLLKGANTNQVLKDVIDRVAEIQKSLPEGIFINPFLERSALLARTTFTISENLILGALIVIFVVILLLGNFRSGLIIASLIPLSLLFALGMMNVFGVSANLMSLGAIDFGIIIDGAIIIVEFVLFSITQKSKVLRGLTGKEYSNKKDEIAIKNSSYMMRSAIFGQIIILIVFLPILTLQGVEGKMFRPMGMVFSFALIGAMLLCLTYVPMMAALFIKPASKEKNFADRFIDKLQRAYDPVIRFILNFKKGVIAVALLFLIGSFYIFSTMGGEFVPTLDEGDIVIQPLIASGTSLGQVIKLTTMMEGLLKEKFSEIEQVVSRIGAAEVPTDPMSMEEVDMIITLKPKSEWKRASTKDELIEVIEEELNQIPGMEYEFTQPIEMRFNELISGARADISVKIYGEDLDILYNKAVKAKSLIDGIAGAADVVVDKVENMPQVRIAFNRDKLAQYGLNVSEINETIQMAFAGLAVGEVYDGEKRFDIVMRYSKDNREKITDINNTLIDLPNGDQVPLSMVTDIKTVDAPSKISRDDTKRRVSVGINVRNRDLESVVLDIKQILDSDLNLPAGYSVKYGGQFENLERARTRLMIVVPMALILIFLLLYMTFKSVGEATLIYTAIPLAATGGILLLWVRGMPFSISAGIGFIALFGIAVLNGIVLIEHYKHMKLSDFKNIKEMVIAGTKDRIRPVLLTASAAALGFLPMAISGSSGAEVQRPLATAVIGGLITSTILTLIMVPLLYVLLVEWREKKMVRKGLKTLILLPLLWMGTSLSAQEGISLDVALEMAKENSPIVKIGQLNVEKNASLQKQYYRPGITNISYAGDALFEGNSNQVHQYGVSQEFENPLMQNKRNKVQKSITGLSEIDLQKREKWTIYNVKKTYYALQKTKALLSAYKEISADYDNFVGMARTRKELGASNTVELLTMESEYNKLTLDIQQLEVDVTQFESQLAVLIGKEGVVTTSDPFEIVDEVLANGESLMLLQAKKEVALSQARLGLARAQRLPNFNAGYAVQDYYQGGKLTGLEVGMTIPLFDKSLRKQKKARGIEVEIANEEVENKKRLTAIQSKGLTSKMDVQKNRAKKLKTQIETDLPEMLRVARLNYHSGTLNYLELVNMLNLYIDFHRQYVQAIQNYKMAAAEYNYIH